MLPSERVERIIANARRFGTPALAVAVALDLVAPYVGRTWHALCCSCLEAVDHTLPDAYVYRLSYSTTRSAGDCLRCPYSGCDVLVVSLPT